MELPELNISKKSRTFDTYFKRNKAIKNGSRGYRSPHLAHAKRALYHLSYAPASSIGHVSLALES